MVKAFLGEAGKMIQAFLSGSRLQPQAICPQTSPSALLRSWCSVLKPFRRCSVASGARKRTKTRKA